MGAEGRMMRRTDKPRKQRRNCTCADCCGGGYDDGRAREKREWQHAEVDRDDRR